MYCPHEHTQIVGQRLDQIPLLAVLETSHREPSHASGLAEMSKSPLHQVRPLSSERFAVFPSTALAVEMELRPGSDVPLPLAPSLGLFLRDVGGDASVLVDQWICVYYGFTTQESHRLLPPTIYCDAFQVDYKKKSRLFYLT